jgi:hypothetical protein
MSDIIAFANKYNLNSINVDSLILNMQNCAIFVIGISSFVSSFYYTKSSCEITDYTCNSAVTNYLPFDILIPTICIYSLVDLFALETYDFKLHHMCIFGLIFYNYYYNGSLADLYLFVEPLIKTEISSIFFVLKYWLPKKTPIYAINNLLFYASFAKLRLFDYYYDLLHNNQLINTIIQKYSENNYLMSGILISSCYGLYIINLYWFLIMNKVLFKLIASNIHINRDDICQIITAYAHWLNIPLSVYIYIHIRNIQNIYLMSLE